VEEEIARALRHIDLLQLRTTELRNEDFMHTWDKVGQFDSLDLRELEKALQANLSEEGTKQANLEEKMATISGQISELKEAIRKYCDEKGYPETRQKFIPRPMDDGPSEEEEATAANFADANATIIDGELEGASEVEETSEAEGDAAKGIDSDAALLEACYRGWELTAELGDLSESNDRYKIFKTIEDALAMAGEWVGPNFYETEMYQINIVNPRDKQSSILGMLGQVGDMVSDLKDMQLENALGALGKYKALCKATDNYAMGGSDSERDLLAAVKFAYPMERDKFESKYYDADTGEVNTAALLAEIQKRKDRERSMAWAAQNDISESLPKIVTAAREVLEDLQTNGFEKHSLVNDLARKMRAGFIEDPEDTDRDGIIPTLGTMQMVLAPELVRLTDIMQHIIGDDEVRRMIDEQITPEQMKILDESDYIIMTVNRYLGMKVMLDIVRSLRDRQIAIELAAQFGGELKN
jgi:hypothetical protein